MQETKRCGHCDTLNEPQRMYCKNCRRYLKVTQRSEERVTIWGMDGSGTDLSGCKSGAAAAAQVVKCPSCGAVAPVVDGMLPLTCSACNYFFQAGIDRVISETEAREHTGETARVPDQPVSVDRMSDNTDVGQKYTRTNVPADSTSAQGSQKKASPLGRAVKDSSRLRLLSLSNPAMMPENFREEGNILGKDATIMKQLKTDMQATVWHTPAGWYIRAVSGAMYMNGRLMNEGIQRRLSDGDLFLFGGEQFRVELS